MKIPLIAALWLLTAASAQAEIYQCMIDGVKSFSQQPCGADAKTVTTSNAVRKITIPAVIDEKAAEEICNLMTGAWDMAAVRSRNTGKGRIDTETHTFAKDAGDLDKEMLGKQVMHFMKERIANYQELQKSNPFFLMTLTMTSAIMVGSATREPNPDSATLRNFRAKCVPQFIKKS